MLRGAHLAYDASREGRAPGGMNSFRRDRVAPRLVRLGAGLVVGGTLVAAPEAPAYRLMHDREGAILGGESGAFRWPDDAWPLRYRLLENDLLPVDVFADHDAWREFLGAAFQQWNDIPTAEVDIRLEGEPVMQRDGSDGDGINTIGFSADLEATGGRINGRVSWVLEGDRLVGCDVMVNPAYPATLPEEDRLEKLTGLVLHEIGHCLPLLHSDPMPMTIHVELPGVNLTGFSPDPAMSYGNFRESLTVDDMVAASLLYPAPEFRDSTGGLTGTVRFDDGAPVRYIYAQAVEIGSTRPRAGPGMFTDEDGRFLVEGLRPGPVMLWFHPSVIPGAHQFVGEFAFWFQDQWLFAEVTAGETTEVPAIALRRGRATIE